MTFKPVLSKPIISFIVSLVLFMDALDTTIINTAIPAIAHTLQVNPVDIKLALISYLISLAIFIPISGWVADKYGIKRIFIAALAVFTISSIWCGYANSLPELVLARSMQGLGGAFMLPLGRLMLLRTFQRHELVDAMNRVIIVVSLGVMLGPVAGGFITDHFSWHWIFWVNIPVGFLTITMSAIWFDQSPPKHVRPFDTIGFILFGGGIASLTFALSDISQSIGDHHTAIYIMCIGILMLSNYSLYSRRQPHPIIEVKLLRIRTFQVSIIGNLIARLGFGGIPFLLPLLMQIGLGLSAELSGMLLVPIALGIVTVKLFSLKLLRLFGYKKLLLTNTLLVGLSLWAFQMITPATPLYIIALLTYLFGVLISLQYSGMNSLAYADITADDLSSATSIVSTTQQIAQSFGVASAAAILHYYAITPDGTLNLTPVIFHQTFFVMGILTFFSTFIFLHLSLSDGHQMLKAPARNGV